MLWLSGIAEGEFIARLAHKLGLARREGHTLGQCIQAKLKEDAPTGVMTDAAFEADDRRR
jgi:hypothetical protein